MYTNFFENWKDSNAFWLYQQKRAILVWVTLYICKSNVFFCKIESWILSPCKWIGCEDCNVIDEVEGICPYHTDCRKKPMQWYFRETKTSKSDYSYIINCLVVLIVLLQVWPIEVTIALMLTVKKWQVVQLLNILHL